MPVVTIVGGTEAARERIAALVADAGFRMWPAPAAGGLLILPDAPTELERLRTIRTAAEAHPDCLILAVVAAAAGNASLRRVLLAGATGIVAEADVDRALVATLRAMVAGQLTVPITLGRQIAPRPLSHREKEVLQQLVLGATNREIAQRLYLAESTVKTHLSSAFRKLDARSRAEAVARILDPESGYGVGILELGDRPLAAAS